MKKIIIVLLGIFAIACSDDEVFKDRLRIELPFHYQKHMSQRFPNNQISCRVTGEIKKKTESSYVTSVTCKIQTPTRTIESTTDTLVVREGEKDFIFKSI